MYVFFKVSFTQRFWFWIIRRNTLESDKNNGAHYPSQKRPEFLLLFFLAFSCIFIEFAVFLWDLLCEFDYDLRLCCLDTRRGRNTCVCVAPPSLSAPSPADGRYVSTSGAILLPVLTAFPVLR